MKVFGLGLSKTGTCSLNAALNELGIKSTHGPNDETTQREILNGELRLSILDQYDALTDIPMALYYADLDKLYPSSKFILTVRQIDDWLDSMRRHYSRRKIKKWNSFIRACAYGCIGFNAHRLRIAYEHHIKRVQDYFAGRNDLLVINICEGDGWDKLCPFLNKPIPDYPFPWKNDFPNREETKHDEFKFL